MSVSIMNLSGITLVNTTVQTKGPLTGKAWLVKSLMITNREATTRTIDVKVQTAASTAYFIAPPAMALAPNSTTIIDSEITLKYVDANGQLISLQALGGGTPSVDCVFNGLERDL